MDILQYHQIEDGMFLGQWTNDVHILGSGCVAQLVERLLPIPEVRGSNPVIGKNLFI